MSPTLQTSTATGDDTHTGHTPAQFASIAARLFRTGPYLLRTTQRYRPAICPFEALLPWVPPSGKLLDVGCGCGLWLGLLSELNIPSSGVGFDSSAKAIGVAQSMRARLARPDSVHIQHLDVRADWPLGPFDAVSIIDVLHHVPPAARQSVLALAASRLAPGGTLIYKDMSCRTWRAHMNRLHDLVMAREWISYTPVEVVEHWARELGLELSHSSNHTRYWYAHELRVFRKPA